MGRGQIADMAEGGGCGYERVCGLAELQAGGRKRVTLNGRIVVIFHVNGQVYALDHFCYRESVDLTLALLIPVSIKSVANRMDICPSFIDRYLYIPRHDRHSKCKCTHSLAISARVTEIFDAHTQMLADR